MVFDLKKDGTPTGARPILAGSPVIVMIVYGLLGKRGNMCAL
jgi:hypothetical protein